jgi:hypothetical protein
MGESPQAPSANVVKLFLSQLSEAVKIQPGLYRFKDRRFSRVWVQVRVSNHGQLRVHLEGDLRKYAYAPVTPSDRVWSSV